MKLLNKNREWKERILRTIFPHLKLKDKNISWYKKIFVYLEIFIMVWVILWLLFLMFYHVMFLHKYNHENLTFYTNKNLSNNKSFSNILERVDRQLDKYNIKLKNLNADIYIVNNDLMYMVGMTPGMQIFLRYADAYTAFGSIYFKKVDIENNKSYSYESKQYFAPFTLVLGHELVHIWQENYIGYIKFILLPQWIKEGYAVYVTEEYKNIKSEKDFITWAKDDLNNLPTGELYTLYGLMIKHSIEEMNKTIEDLHLGKVNYEEVLKSLLKKHNFYL